MRFEVRALQPAKWVPFSRRYFGANMMWRFTKQITYFITFQVTFLRNVHYSVHPLGPPEWADFGPTQISVHANYSVCDT